MDCSICLTALISGQALGVLPCGHGFHHHCIQSAITQLKKCPMCRLETDDIRRMPIDLRELPQVTQVNELTERLADRDEQLRVAQVEVTRLRLAQQTSDAERREEAGDLRSQIEALRLRLSELELQDRNAQEVRELVSEVNQAQVASVRSQLEAAELRRERTELRYGRLLDVHRDMRRASADIHRRLPQDDWGLSRISIRNVSDRAAADPQQVVADLLQFIRVHVEPEYVRVLGSEPMVNYPGWHIRLDCREEFTKLEITVKFPRVAHHSQPDMRVLTLRDWTETKVLFRLAKQRLGGMPEVPYIGIRNNQLAYRRRNDPHNYELESEADIEWLYTQVTEARAARAERDAEPVPPPPPIQPLPPPDQPLPPPDQPLPPPPQPPQR